MRVLPVLRGLLRKVLKVEGADGEYVVSTAPASLTDVIEKGKVHASFELNDNNQWEVVGGDADVSETVLAANLKKWKLFELTGTGWKANASLRINFDLDTSASLTFSGAERLYGLAGLNADDSLREGRGK